MSLNFRERHGLASIVNLTMQCVLERMTSDFSPDAVLCEIESVVLEATTSIRARKAPAAYSSSTIQLNPVLCQPAPPPHALLLTNELLSRIFRYVHHSSFPSTARFGALIRETHVCRRWRTTAIQDPSLWCTLSGLSSAGLDAIETVLRRSGTRPLHVDLNLTFIRGDAQDRVIEALTANLHRTRYLALSFGREYDGPRTRTLFTTPAPILEQFHLRSPEYFNIKSSLFDQHAPLLSSITLVNPGGWLPGICPALANVREWNLLNASNTTSLACVDGLSRICTRVRKFSLQSILRGTPPNTEPAPKQQPVSIFGKLEEFTLSEVTTEDSTQIQVQTLRVFDYKTIPTIHLRAGTVPTVMFIFKELQDLKYLFLMRSGNTGLLIVRDSDDKKRIFSRLSGAGVDTLLKRIYPTASTISSIALWEYVHVADLVGLFALELPVLRILTIFVRGTTLPESTYPAQAQHIFTCCSVERLQWKCPSLETLCFTSHAPVEDHEVLPPAARRPVLSAAALKAFVQHTLRADIARPPCLVLDGVLFQEKFSDEAALLRPFFSDIDLYP